MFDSDGGGVVDGASFSEVAPVTNPPPPGNWGPPQPPYNQGQPPYGPGQWPPQQSWGQPPAPPKNNGLKWLLAGVAVLLVIAISVGATLLVTRDGEDGPTAGPSNGVPSANGDIASADDTGPVSIITEDPTCEPSRPIISTLSQRQKQGWAERDITIPASEWTVNQRSMHEDVADAMLRAADQTIELAKLTPHRVMRELYLQAVAYWRAYANAIPTYTETDNTLAVITTDLAGAIVSICAAIQYGSAAERGPLTPAAPTPNFTPIDINVESPQAFLSEQENSVCPEWKEVSRRFDSEITPWQEIDPNLPGSQWTPEQRATMNQAAETMKRYSKDLQEIGARSGNSTFQDFASLSSIYWEAFAASIDSYSSADSYLSSTANYANFTVYYACALSAS